MKNWGKEKKRELRFTEMLSFLRVIVAEQKSAKEYVELTEDERLYAYRLNDEGDYEQLLPNEHGRFELQELNGEIAFEDGLSRIYKDGEKIPTLQEALKHRAV